MLTGSVSQLDEVHGYGFAVTGSTSKPRGVAEEQRVRRILSTGGSAEEPAWLSLESLRMPGADRRRSDGESPEARNMSAAGSISESPRLRNDVYGIGG